MEKLFDQRELVKGSVPTRGFVLFMGPKVLSKQKKKNSKQTFRRAVESITCLTPIPVQVELLFMTNFDILMMGAPMMNLI